VKLDSHLLTHVNDICLIYLHSCKYHYGAQGHFQSRITRLQLVRMRLASHVASIGDMRNAYKISSENLKKINLIVTVLHVQILTNRSYRNGMLGYGMD
jgi:hypothetical protein